MSGAALNSTRGTLRQDADGSSHAARAVRAIDWYEREVDRRYLTTHGYHPKARQRETMAEHWRWMDLCELKGEDEILRSIPQFIDGPGRRLGWTHTGTVRGDQQSYGNRVRRTLRYLRSIGVGDGYRSVYKPSGEGVGILVMTSPCSSTGRAADS